MNDKKSDEANEKLEALMPVIDGIINALRE
jgi:hypothetical protein